MKIKRTAAALMVSVLAASSVYAADYTEIYNNFLTNVEIPQTGICDTSKSYEGHEDEDIISYYSGLISAFTADLDGDGEEELLTVEDNLIKIYGSAEDGENLPYLADIKQNLISTEGRSYANVFLKPYDGMNFLCVEYFNENGSSKAYSLKIYALNKETKTLPNLPRVKIEKKIDDESVSESVSGVVDVGTVSYSYSNISGTEYLVNNANYEDCIAAAKAVLAGSGFENSDFIETENRLNLYIDAAEYDYRIASQISDIIPQTHIRAEGIRNGSTPSVLFEDYSMLSELSIPEIEVSVTVDGEKIEFADQNPVIIDNRTLVPVRGVFEALGAEVKWIGESQKVVVNTDTTNIVLTIDSNEFYVNGDLKYLDVPAQLINDRTMIPVRFISESLGNSVEWNAASSTVVIKTGE